MANTEVNLQRIYLNAKDVMATVFGQMVNADFTCANDCAVIRRFSSATRMSSHYQFYQSSLKEKHILGWSLIISIILEIQSSPRSFLLFEKWIHFKSTGSSYS
jgi:hypothetical protein